jgi:DNA (cytosine-5)-methyltransferase 1
MINELILKKRENLDLTRKEFSDWLGLNKDGQKLIKLWEEGKTKVPQSFIEKIQALPSKAPFAQSEKENYKFKFIDLFAGIGGIRLPFQKVKGQCVFSSEWDKFAQKTYRINYGDVPHGDITKISTDDIPEHDILVGGFPCQPFSQAGLKKGFSDPRGTLFFDIQKILVHKRPKAFLLENVKQLKGHNKGETLKSILSILEGRNIIDKSELAQMKLSKEALKALSTKLNYHVTFQVLNANKFGVPQNRERIYLVGFDKDQAPKDFDFSKAFQFPEPKGIEVKVGDILEDNKTVNDKYTLSEKLWSGHVRRKEEHKNKGNGFGYCLFNKDSAYTNTISARYYKDGSEVLIDQSDIKKRPRKLTPRECARLQGFPENYIIPVSDMQAYKQYGNSVAMPVIEALAKNMLATLKSAKMI